LNFFKKNTETEPEPKPVQTDQFQFGFLEQNRFKLVWLGFFWFGSVFSVWLGVGLVFFWFGLVFFGLGSVWFFQFQAYKTKTEPNRSVFLKF
jgi:hypothetical protein